MAEYPVPTCSTVDFASVPSALEFPYKALGCLDQVVQLGERQLSTAYGFSTCMVDKCKFGYFVISSGASNNILGSNLDTTCNCTGDCLGIEAPGTVEINGSLVEVVEAVAFHGTESFRDVGDTVFMGKGHPALLTKVQLSGVDAFNDLKNLLGACAVESQITGSTIYNILTRLEAEVIRRARPEELARLAQLHLDHPTGSCDWAFTTEGYLTSGGFSHCVGAEQKFYVWLAQPLPKTIILPARSKQKKTGNLTIEVQSGAVTFDVCAIVDQTCSSSCVDVGTQGIAVWSTEAESLCWRFFPLQASSIVVKAEAPIPKGDTGNFTLLTARDSLLPCDPASIYNGTPFTAVALADFRCAGQIGQATLDADCKWKVSPMPDQVEQRQGVITRGGNQGFKGLLQYVARDSLVDPLNQDRQPATAAYIAWLISQGFSSAEVNAALYVPSQTPDITEIEGVLEETMYEGEKAIAWRITSQCGGSLGGWRFQRAAIPRMITVRSTGPCACGAEGDFDVAFGMKTRVSIRATVNCDCFVGSESGFTAAGEGGIAMLYETEQFKGAAPYGTSGMYGWNVCKMNFSAGTVVVPPPVVSDTRYFARVLWSGPNATYCDDYLTALPNATLASSYSSFGDLVDSSGTIIQSNIKVLSNRDVPMTRFGDDAFYEVELVDSGLSLWKVVRDADGGSIAVKYSNFSAGLNISTYDYVIGSANLLDRNGAIIQAKGSNISVNIAIPKDKYGTLVSSGEIVDIFQHETEYNINWKCGFLLGNPANCDAEYYGIVAWNFNLYGPPTINLTQEYCTVDAALQASYNAKQKHEGVLTDKCGNIIGSTKISVIWNPRVKITKFGTDAVYRLRRRLTNHATPLVFYEVIEDAEKGVPAFGWYGGQTIPSETGVFIGTIVDEAEAYIQTVGIPAATTSYNSILLKTNKYWQLSANANWMSGRVTRPVGYPCSTKNGTAFAEAIPWPDKLRLMTPWSVKPAVWKDVTHIGGAQEATYEEI